MKSPIAHVFVLSSMLLAAAAPLASQSAKQPVHEPKTIGVGIQSSFPVYGASVMINTNSRISVQGILGAFGTLKMYGGRALYRFDAKSNLQPYAFGMLGSWSYEGYELSSSGMSIQKSTETVFGLGAGGGVEYFFQGLPDLGFNAEVGYGSAKFKQIDYDFSAISFGVGIHYYIR